MRKDGIFLLIPNPHHGEDVSVDLIKKVLKEQKSIVTNGLKLHSFILLDFSPPDHAMYSKNSSSLGKLPNLLSPASPGHQAQPASFPP